MDVVVWEESGWGGFMRWLNGEAGRGSNGVLYKFVGGAGGGDFGINPKHVKYPSKLLGHVCNHVRLPGKHLASFGKSEKLCEIPW